jgi:methionyl-tRNA synthetase
MPPLFRAFGMILKGDAPIINRGFAAMDQAKKRCMVCGKEDPGGDTICETCKAHIRGEAIQHREEIKKDSDRALHKEGTQVEKK